MIFRLPLCSIILTLAMVCMFYVGTHLPVHLFHDAIIDSTLFDQTVFDKKMIFNGEYWRLFSGHFVHSDSQHLLWNALGLLMLGMMLEQRSTPALWISVGFGIVSVSAWLLSPWSQLSVYCGLSGVLNSLLVMALWLEWRRDKTLIYLVVGCLALAKILVELSTQQALFIDTHWPPYPPAHLAGFLGGLMAVILVKCRRTSSEDGNRKQLIGTNELLLKSNYFKP